MNAIAMVRRLLGATKSAPAPIRHTALVWSGVSITRRGGALYPSPFRSEHVAGGLQHVSCVKWRAGLEEEIR